MSAASVNNSEIVRDKLLFLFENVIVGGFSPKIALTALIARAYVLTRKSLILTRNGGKNE